MLQRDIRHKALLTFQLIPLTYFDTKNRFLLFPTKFRYFTEPNSYSYSRIFFLTSLQNLLLQISSTDLPGWFRRLLCTNRRRWHYTEWCILVCIWDCVLNRFHDNHISSVYLVHIQNGLQGASCVQWINLPKNVAIVEIVDGRRPKWENHQFTVQWSGQIWHWIGVFTRCLERSPGSVSLFRRHLHWDWHLCRRWNGIPIQFCTIAR